MLGLAQEVYPSTDPYLCSTPSQLCEVSLSLVAQVGTMYAKHPGTMLRVSLMALTCGAAAHQEWHGTVLAPSMAPLKFSSFSSSPSICNCQSQAYLDHVRGLSDWGSSVWRSRPRHILVCSTRLHSYWGGGRTSHWPWPVQMESLPHYTGL